MEKKKKRYAKPRVQKVKLVVEGAVLGICWTDNSTLANASSCNDGVACPQ